jgi:hypothetical protein
MQAIGAKPAAGSVESRSSARRAARLKVIEALSCE